MNLISHKIRYLEECGLPNRYRITWGWVNYDRIFFSGKTIPLILLQWCEKLAIKFKERGRNKKMPNIFFFFSFFFFLNHNFPEGLEGSVISANGIWVWKSRWWKSKGAKFLSSELVFKYGKKRHKLYFRLVPF